MLFDVPFVPEEEYVQFLKERLHRLYSVHFSLYSSEIFDARYRFETFSTEKLAGLLSGLHNVKKYLLINGRFHHSDSYFDIQLLQASVEKIQYLSEKAGISGVIFSDNYFLQALSDFAPGVISGLEAVPSINMMLDSFDRFQSLLEAISATKFKLPGKVVLDRSLNRKFDELNAFSSELRSKFPDMRIGLLANEGCLFQCPYKLTHDSHISFFNIVPSAESSFSINRSFGCARILRNKPELLFKSPFIRPEDLSSYEGVVDVIKVCGRNLGTGFLKRAIGAYLDGKYSGNLLDLMDAMDWLSDHYYVDNGKIPGEFLSKVSSCDRSCDRCDYCKGLFDMTATESMKEQKSIPVLRFF